MNAAGPRGAGFALFLDFDGTLVDLAETPDAVVVDRDLPRPLVALRHALGGAAAIVTGRPVADIDRFLPGIGFDLCGLHGLERRVAGADATPPGLRDLGPEIATLRARLAGLPGVIVEGKGVGVAVHWRLAPDAEAAAKAALDEIAGRLGPEFKVQDGKMVREILPARAGKGAGIRGLMTEAAYGARVPVFAGDDRTDEDGFLAVNALGGLSVKVGPGPTVAGSRLGDVAALRAWLADWATGRPAPPPLPPS